LKIRRLEGLNSESSNAAQAGCGCSLANFALTAKLCPEHEAQKL
jgi:hypothetical protein